MEEVKTEKPTFRKWWGGKSRKAKAWLIMAMVMLFIMIAISVVLCVLFIEPIYNVDLSKVIRDENIIWRDEFDGETLNADIWAYGGSEKSLEEDPVGNYDVGGAYHKPQAVRLEDGKLNIHIEYNEEAQQWWCGGVNTMRTDTHNGYMQKFGYFEIKAKLADFGGCWSTFWLLGENYDELQSRDAKTAGAEIDIIESPLWPQNKIQQAVHIGGPGSNHFSMPNPRYLTKTYDKNLYKGYLRTVLERRNLQVLRGREMRVDNEFL